MKKKRKKKRLEEQLFQAQKLESLGRLSAGLAHEINTPAQYVSDNLFFLKDVLLDVSALLGETLATMSVLEQKAGSIPELVRLRELFEQLDAEFITREISTALDHSLEGMERINRIVVATKGFSYNGSDKIEANINDAIAKTITLCGHEWKYVATIETDFAPELPAVPCFISSINQVVLNMIVNAAQAIKMAGLDGKHGRITIRTRQVGGLCQH